MPHEHETNPACILAMREMIAQTASETASRVEHMLEPVMKRLTAVEYRIHGNGTPGLAEQIRELQRVHEDSRKLRATVLAALMVHAAAIVGVVWWSAQWVAKVNHHMHAAEEIHAGQ